MCTFWFVVCAFDVERTWKWLTFEQNNTLAYKFCWNDLFFGGRGNCFHGSIPFGSFYLNKSSEFVMALENKLKKLSCDIEFTLGKPTFRSLILRCSKITGLKVPNTQFLLIIWPRNNLMMCAQFCEVSPVSVFSVHYLFILLFCWL